MTNYMMRERVSLASLASNKKKDKALPEDDEKPKLQIEMKALPNKAKA